ncbi:hypothetical protein DICPUDRAFT_90436 [Dictyostelium purpureum]|uniref:Ras guanine nucleotide exchange factor n=1 Tax=Dictyostelium purpureum TaxID=5786 RepID=F1A2K6_DICPU|nr:uncharacterized protein DICPUDRAFT_90436 [Dictyostelium purpureum]EGC29568.1 hypothetical protein DICPUDRAFT_90436 [Dictyostelium purpureum]|eukprot:XP_003293900.1 hypothetical protein DICPUDRAFT_90436 [Dictyostelium purpureum]
MKEEEIAKLGPSEYFNYLEGINKKIIIELKTVCSIDLVVKENSDNSQNIFLESSLALEHNVKNLMYFIDMCPISCEQITHYHAHYKEVVKILFQVVTELISSAQGLILNSNDYLTTSSYTKCKAEAIKTIKNAMATCSNFEKLYYDPDLQLEEESDYPQQLQQQQYEQQQREQQQKEEEEYEQQQSILRKLKQEEEKKQEEKEKQKILEQEKEEQLKKIQQQKEQQQKEQQQKQQQQQQQFQQRKLSKGLPPTPQPKELPPVPISNSNSTSNGASKEGISSSNENITNSPGSRSSLTVPTGKITESHERVHNFDRGTANIILNINKIKEIALNGNSEQAPEIVIAAKVISDNIAIISKELRYKTLGTNLSDHFVSLVQIARLALKNKSDQFYQDQLELAIEKFNDTMRKIIYSVKSISKSSINLRQFGVDDTSLSRSPVTSPEKPSSPNFYGERVNDFKNLPNHQPIQSPQLQDNEKLVLLKRKEKQHLIVVPRDIKDSQISSPLSTSTPITTPTSTTPIVLTPASTTPMPQTPKESPSQQFDKEKEKDKEKDKEKEKDKSKDKEKDKDKQKTLGKLFSKISNKKRTPLPGFDPNSANNSSTSPQSSSNSSMETSPSVSSPTITSNNLQQSITVENLDIEDNSDTQTPTPQPTPPSHHHNNNQHQHQQQQQQPSYHNLLQQQQQLNSSASRLSSPNLYSSSNKIMTPKKERSFTIGLVSGKHSCVVLETPRSKKLFQHESAKQILSIISASFPSFEKEFQMQNNEVISNIMEQIGNVIQTYHDEVSDSSSSSSSSVNNNSTPSDVSPILNSENSYDVSPTLKKLYENGTFDGREHSRSSIQTKISRKLGTIRKKGQFNLMNTSFGNLSTIDDSSMNTSNENDPSENLVSTSSAFAEEALELVGKCFETSVIVNHSNSDIKPMFISTLDHLESMLESSLSFGKIDPSSSLCSVFLKNIKVLIPNMKGKSGKVDPTLVTAATKLFRHTVLSNLDKSIHSLCHSVRVIAIQITIIVISINTRPWDIGQQLQLFAAAKSFVESLSFLMDAVENKIYISTNTSNQDDVVVPNIDSEEDINIWDEPDGPSTFKVDWISDEGSKTGRYVPKAGTLNRLISALTQDNKHDISRYTKTFLLTYQSFTNPWKLMEKLIQRYNIPADEKPELKAITQLRVVSFMQTWIEKNFNDFDEQLIAQVKEFRTRLLMDNNNDLAVILGGLIKKKEIERNQLKDRTTTSLLTFPELMIPDGQKSPTALFLLLNESEIARQLTLIDFNIFLKIQPTELLDQAWNKDSLKFKSPNVIEMINRANKFSFWVSSQILWQETIEERAKVFEKFIIIAKHLRDMNNFNTLLAIFTGLNTAPILRLKKTFAMLSPNSLAIYNSLEKLMNSSGSYKNYRSVPKNPPFLPYLPVILSDLTFMEDGNPDKINGLINFQKRELICRVISEVQQCQNFSKYDYPVVEPIHTLLTELPSSTPAELYHLSLSREPRESNGNNNSSSISVGSNYLNSPNSSNISVNDGFDTLKKYYKSSNNNN